MVRLGVQEVLRSALSYVQWYVSEELTTANPSQLERVDLIKLVDEYRDTQKLLGTVEQHEGIPAGVKLAISDILKEAKERSPIWDWNLLIQGKDIVTWFRDMSAENERLDHAAPAPTHERSETVPVIGERNP